MQCTSGGMVVAPAVIGELDSTILAAEINAQSFTNDASITVVSVSEQSSYVEARVCFSFALSGTSISATNIASVEQSIQSEFESRAGKIKLLVVHVYILLIFY